MSPALILSDLRAARVRALDGEAARIVARLGLILDFTRAMGWRVAHLMLHERRRGDGPIDGLEPSPSEPIFTLRSGEAPDVEALFEVLGGRPVALVLGGYGLAELITPLAKVCRGVGWPVVLLEDATAWGPDRELCMRALTREGVRMSTALALTAPPNERLTRLIHCGVRMPPKLDEHEGA